MPMSGSSPCCSIFALKTFPSVFVCLMVVVPLDMYGEPTGPQAARLRQRKFDLARRFQIPDDLLPGSLSLSHLRCGKPTCHCAQRNDPRHPVWSLTFMVK